jgi:thymidylate synthase
MTNVRDVRREFISKYQYSDFTTGRGGHKMIEIIGASFLADEPAIFGTVNQDYVDAEITWYESMSTNVNDIGEKVPAAWQSTANEHGEINSNYGHLIYSPKYHRQYVNVSRELRNNPDSRRATMVYNRPSIWVEYDENGKNDFICTNAVTYYVRDDLLHAVVQMRSNDVVFGYKNDYAWQKHVLELLARDLSDREVEGGLWIDPGTITWQVQNLHIYERHFHLIEDYTG